MLDERSRHLRSPSTCIRVRTGRRRSNAASNSAGSAISTASGSDDSSTNSIPVSSELHTFQLFVESAERISRRSTPAARRASAAPQYLGPTSDSRGTHQLRRRQSTDRRSTLRLSRARGRFGAPTFRAAGGAPRNGHVDPRPMPTWTHLDQQRAASRRSESTAGAKPVVI